MVIPIIIGLSLSAVGVILKERHSRNHLELQRHYIESILLGGGEGERYLEHLSSLSSSDAKRAAAEVIATLGPIIYRLDQDQLVRISHSLHLCEFLLEQAANNRGVEREVAISQLAQIPSINISKQQLLPFQKDKDRMVHFFALLTIINIDKQNVLHHIASYPFHLTPFELSQLLDLLRRGSVGVAYQPMLSSSSQNLNILGLAIIREYGIESAEMQLRELLESSANRFVCQEILYTLASLQLTLCTPSISCFVKSMGQKARERFLRYVASRGYSQRVIDFFTTKAESQRFHALINSYKIKIECY